MVSSTHPLTRFYYCFLISDWLKVLVDLSTSESWLLRQQATECVRTVVDHTPSHVFDLLEQLLQWNLVC